MNIVNFLSITTLSDLRDIVNIESRYKYIYCSLNTSTVASSTGNKYKWNLNDGSNSSDQAVDVYNKMKNIVGIRLSPFILDFTLNGSDDYTFYQFNLLIDEFMADSQTTATGRNFHFNILNADNPTQESKTRAYVNGSADGYYWFKNPFSSISTVTISVAKVEDGSLIALPNSMCIHLQFIYLDKEDVE